MESNSALYEKILSSVGGMRRPMGAMKKLGVYSKPVNNRLGYYNYEPSKKYR